MTKKLECPFDGCHSTIEADSEDAVMSQAEAHAGSAHPDLELDEETVAHISSNIRDV